MPRLLRALALYALVLIPCAVGVAAGEAPALKPDKAERCPVCGMFVAKHPAWIGHVAFRDGSGAYFDGPKDLFAYCLDLAKNAHGRTRDDIASITVSDYYSLAPIDATRAFFVIGSDVRGPMGNELVPFEREDSAREFMKDHKGKRLFRFQEVNPAVLKGLD